MRFTQQKTLILLCFLLLPMVSLFALFESRDLSQFVLQFVTRVLSFRTGVPMMAKEWNVNPLSFSASLKGFRMKHQRVHLEVEEFRVRVSPLGLLIGKLNVRSGELRGGALSIATSPSSDATPKIEDPPTWFSDQLIHFNQRLSARNVAIQSLMIDGLSIQAADLSIGKMQLYLDNYGDGQAHLRMSAESIRGKDWGPMDRFAVTMTLMKDRMSRRIQLSIPEIFWGQNSEQRLRLSGRFPGSMDVSLDLPLADLDRLLARRADYIKFQEDLQARGHISAQGKIDFQSLSQFRTSLNVDWKEALLRERHKGVWTDYSIHRVQMNPELDWNQDVWSARVQNGTIFLPTYPRNPSGSNQLRIQNIRLDAKAVEGELVAQQASLCSILFASGVPDCWSHGLVDGPIKIQGALEPFQLTLQPQLRFSQGRIASDDYRLGDDTFLLTSDLVLEGAIEVGAKDMIFRSVAIRLGDETSMLIDGPVNYVPTRVNFEVKGQNIALEQITRDLFGLEIKGNSDLEVLIQYDHARERVDRTRVSGTVRTDMLSISGQDIGAFNGSIRYWNRTLFFQGLDLKRGGGDGEINGKLMRVNDRPFLEVQGDFRNFEIAVGEPGKEDVSGLLSGFVRLSGHTDRIEDLTGDGRLMMRDLGVVGFRFNQASGSLRFEQGSLRFENLEAVKDGGRAWISGEVGPKKTEIRFQSDGLPMRELDLLPFLANHAGGEASFQGFWNPKLGWEVSGAIQNFQIHGRTMDRVNFDLKGGESRLRVGLQSAPSLDFLGDFQFVGESLIVQSLKGKVADDGLYLTLAYLGEWIEPVAVEFRGGVQLDWTEKSGSVGIQSLEVFRLGEASRRQSLLQIPEQSVLRWKDNRFVESELASATHGLNWQVTDGRELQIFLELPSQVLGLVVPGLLFERGVMRGRISLRPPLTWSAWSGELSFTDKTMMRISGVESDLDDLQGSLLLRPGRVVIQEGRATMGEGFAAFRGYIDLEGLSPDIRIEAQLSQAKVLLKDQIELVLSGDLNFVGRQAPYVLQGSLRAISGVYGLEFSSETAPVESSGEPVRLDLVVDVSDEFAVRNSLVNSQFRGRLFVKGDSTQPLPEGILSFVPGGRFVANETEFTVTQGQVEFPPGVGAEPVLSIQALAEIEYNQKYQITLRMNGRATNPSLVFSSDPPLSTPDIVSLLAFGVIQNADQTQDVEAIKAATAFQAIFGKSLGKVIQSKTGFQVQVKTGQSFSGQSVAPKVSLVRRLSDRLTATLGSTLETNNPARDVRLDYKLFQNVGVTGVVENPENDPSYGVDLRFRFDIK